MLKRCSSGFISGASPVPDIHVAYIYVMRNVFDVGNITIFVDDMTFIIKSITVEYLYKLTTVKTSLLKIMVIILHMTRK